MFQFDLSFSPWKWPLFRENLERVSHWKHLPGDMVAAQVIIGARRYLATKAAQRREANVFSSCSLWLQTARSCFLSDMYQIITTHPTIPHYVRIRPVCSDGWFSPLYCIRTRDCMIVGAWYQCRSSRLWLLGTFCNIIWHLFLYASNKTRLSSAMTKRKHKFSYYDKQRLLLPDNCCLSWI